MNMDKNNKKTLFLIDIDPEWETILQKVVNNQPENMLTLQSYGPEISHPYGDIMRSIIIAVYQENVEEIFVVGSKDKGTESIDIESLLYSENNDMKDKVERLDYLFQNCRPEFSGGKVIEWLEGKKNTIESIEKSVDTIRNHPFIPSYVKVRGLIMNNKSETSSVIDVSTRKPVTLTDCRS
ncbi:carbonic anhydrase [Halalkalibacter hemicellulosilyticus]|uniref:Carbonic anhydrase n=1 Tax=Halalkalibacter hemicellulosilyticusJCM 9152 TaxID=1236971 RepID=W4QBE1_9BACI|nr:carbonic anhydrase [Halalkalibacter hemicellulosilyticus]GAE29371.1 carbonic anhydrase [Halalkalibacter hemicellulosilyticusJCM 9152]